VDRYARAYIDSDGASDDPAQRAAYELLPAATRAAWHDDRAAGLVATGEPSWLRGAVPYHAERGSDPPGAGAAAIREAQLSCKGRGLYHAAAELGLRGQRLVDRDSQPDLWWDLTGDVTTSLAALGRADEAEAHYQELRTLTDDPALHMHISYGLAMLYARHYPEPQRDPRQARAWLNQAVALASRLDDPSERAFWTVFNRNGLALVDVREGRPDDALNRLNGGIEQLERELAPDEHLLHRNGLRYNRAQVHMIAGRLEEALADFTHTINRDPNFPDNYFHRANILARLGRPEEAVADYDRAIELTPPMSEVYYNRGDTRADLGDLAGAISDFDRVIELDPDNVDARLNRAGLLCDLGEVEAAWAAVADGLALEPANPRLWCLRGRLLAERGEPAAASEALARALELDDRLAEAYALRGTLAFELGEVAAAVDDLTRALDLGDRESPEIRFNRAVAYQSAGRFGEAVADFDAVLVQTDDPEARQRREACLAAVGAPARV
jgi:tetratricopeptide (TPR) repeat protein